MTWIFKLALRLAPVRKLKARRTELLLDRSYLMTEERQVLSVFGDGSVEFLRVGQRKQRLMNELNAINDEIGRRGK